MQGTSVVQVETWQLIGALVGLAISFGGCVFGFGRMLLGQMDRRLDERFLAQEEARKEASGRHERELKKLESDIRDLAVRLPTEYVRREDWIRFSSTIDAKLDDIREKLYER